MADIFLSYAREDIKKAEMLANALESQGWTVFWDRTSLLAGQDFEAVIDQAIKQAGCMVVAWSEASRQSDWVRGEAGIARERNILVPILFEPVEPPIAFRSLHTENLTDWDGEVDSPDFLKLCKAINERIKAKTEAGTSPTPPNKASSNATNGTKTFSLKRFIRAVWDWLSVTKHQQTLAFVGGGLAVIIAGGWQAYLHFYGQPKETKPTISVSGNGTANTGSMTATASGGGNATNIVGNNNIIGDTNASANIKAIVDTLTNKRQLDSLAKDEQIKALTEAVTTLSKGQGVLGTEAQVKTALDALAKGDTAQAKTLFAQATKKGEHEAKQTAEAYRNLGALAYLDNTQEALAAYRRATELDPNNADGWNNLGLLLQRVGDLDEAVNAYRKVQALGTHSSQEAIALAYNNLGTIYKTRGDLDMALEYNYKALALNESLGRKKGMAANNSNLGSYYHTRGNLDKAIEYHQKSLMLNESLDYKEGMAMDFGNLGNIYQTRGDLDKAIEYYHKAIVLDLNLDRKEGTAQDYGNLGGVYYIRGELDKAFEYYQKALTLNEILDRKVGMADAYSNLGVIYQTRNDLDKAYEYHQKSLALNENLGRKEGMALNYGNIGVVYQSRVNLDKAVEYFKKALSLNESLGRKEGITQDHINLGNVYKQQGHTEQAKQAYLKSIELFKALGNPTMVKKVQGLLDAL